jgi:hypothetical protein
VAESVNLPNQSLQRPLRSHQIARLTSILLRPMIMPPKRLEARQVDSSFRDGG